MKDSDKKSIKSSSDSENPVIKAIPNMPKDKRTKAYKEWVKKYGDQISESVIIPDMPKDKRTKAYKEWVKKYGDQNTSNGQPVKNDKSKSKKTKAKELNLEELIESFVEHVNQEEWFHKRKEIENLREKINLSIKNPVYSDDKFKEAKSNFFLSLKDFAKKKKKYFNELNSNQKENLIKRQELIERIKDLIVVDENPNKLYSKFKLLKEEWHSTGKVPITDRNNIWETYRHHVGKFYDFLHLNRDIREQDYKHNYEEKLKIIERAEKLDEVNDIIKASRDLNDLHRLWKNELGPVSREHSNNLWSRFQAASNKIHSKRQNFQKEISNIQHENYQKKQSLIAKMREIVKSNAETHNDWQNKIKDFENLKINFQEIKNLQRTNNKKSWNDFRIVTKEFNSTKNQFYKNQKLGVKKSINLKKSLIEEVKKIIESNKISESSQRLKSIQEEWKNVPYLPRKISNSLWDEFKPLVDKFYDILKSGAINLNETEQKIFDEKSKYIEKIKFSKKKYTMDEIKESLISSISEYHKIGDLNLNTSNNLNKIMLSKISSLIKSLDIDKDERDDLMFDLEDESNQFQNNLEFFTSSSSDNPLFKNISTKVKLLEDKIEFWRIRLNKLKKI